MIYPAVGPPIFDLKFRQIKLKVYDQLNHKLRWFVLDRLVDFAIKDQKTFQWALDYLPDRYAIRRIYLTSSQFLNPQRLRSESQDKRFGNYLLNSYMTIESDFNMKTSQKIAELLIPELQDRGLPPTILTTGSRSIHMIIKFNFDKYLKPEFYSIYKSTRRFNQKKLLWLEKQARKHFLEIILPEGLDEFMDIKTAIDPRRVIPMPNTFNAERGNWVKILKFEDVTKGLRYIKSKSMISPFEEIYNKKLGERKQEPSIAG